MTIVYCIDLCRSLNQAYAGLQFGQECFCGNSYGKHGETDKKDCFITCAGDRDSTCGGFLKNAVYSVGLYYTTELKTSTEPISTQEFSLPSVFTFETSAQPSSSQTSISSTTLAIQFFTTSPVESTYKSTGFTTNDFFENITTTSTNESTAHEMNTTFVSSFSTLSETSSLFETTSTSSTNLITSLETEHSTNTD
ncbi:glucan endo-1-3-alpha-glucosidase agn1, partial [Brachionus plicatilis]